jgi:hypothetical protein
MAFDYAGLALMAQQLIADAGREVTFALKSRTPADTNKPWRGGDPVAATEFSGIPAAIVPIEFVDQEKQVLKRQAAATLYVSALEFPDSLDVKQLDTVDDGLWTWRVISARPIMPGAVPVIYEMLLEG